MVLVLRKYQFNKPCTNIQFPVDYNQELAICRQCWPATYKVVTVLLLTADCAG
jgi:hypothetical protein